MASFSLSKIQLSPLGTCSFPTSAPSAEIKSCTSFGQTSLPSWTSLLCTQQDTASPKVWTVYCKSCKSWRNSLDTCLHSSAKPFMDKVNHVWSESAAQCCELA